MNSKNKIIKNKKVNKIDNGSLSDDNSDQELQKNLKMGKTSQSLLNIQSTIFIDKSDQNVNKYEK